MYTHDLPYWLAANYLPDISPRKLLACLNYFSDIKTFFMATPTDWQVAGLSAPQIAALSQPNWPAVEKDMAWMQTMPNQTIISMTDPLYPAALKQISDPPLIIYIKGNSQLLSQPQIAIVGSRNPTPTGLKNAEAFAAALAQAGLVVTSGLAIGVDGGCHRGALKVQGLTIAVCGSGLQHLYPSSHRTLAQEMVDKNGAIISEFSLGTPPHQFNFPRRNRIIAGLSLGVLVIEAALKSGSLITARHALEHGREVFAIPGSIHNPLSRGCHYLLKQGATLVETAEDVLEELNGRWTRPRIPALEVASAQYPALSPEQRAILAQIEYEITPLDVIVLRSRLTASKVSSILLILELNGYIQSVSGGYVREVLNQ